MTNATPTDEWSESRITSKENELLQKIIECESPEAVEAAISLASFINMLGLSPDNYPVFLKVLEVENHWVVDALIGDMDPFSLLSAVQPNRHIVAKMFEMMGRWDKGGIYPKNLSVILGVLQQVYRSPAEGFRLFPLSIAQLNNMGKHLDKEQDQTDPINRAILNILGSIADLSERPREPEMVEIARHAHAIRNAFFDATKRMEEVIPPALLKGTGTRKKEIKPRARVSPDELKKRQQAAAKKS